MIRKYLSYSFRLVYANLYLLLMKIFNGKNLRYSPISFAFTSAKILLRPKGRLIMGSYVRLGSYSQLSILGGAELKLGRNVSIGKLAHIAVHERIEIGDNTLVSRAVIYDHDHDFRVPGGVRAGKFKTAPVVIGKNVWICDNVTILRGSVIGDNCIVGAGCVVRGVFPANSIIIQKRETQVIPYEIKED